MRLLFKVNLIRFFTICATLAFMVSMNAQDVLTAKKLAEFKSLYTIGEYDRILSDIQTSEYRVTFDLLELSGKVFHKMGDYENAIQAYSQALIMEDKPELLSLRAAAYLDLGVMDLCLEDLNEAKRKIPGTIYFISR